MRSLTVALFVVCAGCIIAVTAVAAPSRPSSNRGPSSQFLLQTQAPSTALPVLSAVRANEASSQAPPAGQVYIESLPGTPPPFAADPNAQGQNGNQQARIVRRTQPVSRALPSKRFGPNEAISSLNVTGINHWWTFEEDTIGGIGRYMVNVSAGNLIVQADDMAIPHKGISLAFRRTYNSYSQHDYANTDGSVPNNYGDGWTNTFDAHLAQNTLNDPHCGKTGISVYDIDGARYDYAIQYNAQTNSCSYIAPTGQFSVLTFDTTSGLYYWTKPSGTVYMFHNPTDSNAGVAGRLSKTWGRNNNCMLTFTYSFDTGLTKSAATLNKITVQTESTGGASLTATLNFRTFTGINQSSHRLLSTLVWPDGTVVAYKYDSSGRLSEVDEPANSTGGSSIPQIYTYGSTGYLLATAAGGRWSTSNGTNGQILQFDYSGESLVDAQYYGWINPTVSDASGNGPVQPSVPQDYGTHPGHPYRFVSFGTLGSDPSPLPSPAPSPTASAACSSVGVTQWYDSDGHEILYCYDNSERVSQIDTWTGSLWLKSTQSWDSSNDPIATTDPRGNETDYAYDANGNLIAQAEPSVTVIINGAPVTMRPTSFYSYDSHNNLVAKCDPVVVHSAHQDWSATPPPPSDTLCSTTNGIANFSTFAWNTSNGFEPFGELTSKTTALGYTYSLSYAAASQSGADYGLNTSIQGSTFSQGGSSTTPQATYSYDAFGNILCAGRAINATTFAITTYQYDADDRVVEIADPDDGSTISHSVCGKPANSQTIVSSTTYNPNGTVATVQTPSEAAAGVSTQYAYDADGNKLQEVDYPGGQAATTLNYYDAAERLVEVVKPHDANSDTFTFPWMTRYDYDLSAGGSDSVSAGGQVYTLTAHGNLYVTLMYVDTISPNGTVGVPYWAATQFDGFDAADRAIANYREKPVDCYPYGAANGAVTDCSTFSSSTHLFDGSPQTLGLETSSVPSPLLPTLQFTYDSLGRVVSQQANGSTERTYAFDPDGRDAQSTVTGVGTETTSYDLDGRKSIVSEPQSAGFSAPATYSYSYYDNGWVSGIAAAPLGSATAINYTYTFRWDGEPATTTLNYGTDTYTFTYNKTTAGREISMDDPYYLGPSHNQADARAASYDTHGRLLSLTIPAGSYSSIGYDPEANITSLSAYGSASIASSYNLRNEFYKQVSPVGTQQFEAMDGYVNPVAPTDLIDIRAGAKVGAVEFDTGGWSARSTYDDLGRETESDQLYEVPNVGPVTASDSRSYDDQNHLTRDVLTNWNCSGISQITQQGQLSSYTSTLIWGPSGHPTVSTISNNGAPAQSESLHWLDDQLLFTTDSNGNVDDIKVGTVADYIPSASSTTRLTVWDRDENGSIASAHNGTGHALWANLPVRSSVCTAAPVLSNKLGAGAPATQGFSLPSGLQEVFSSLGGSPSGLFIANRTDNVTNQLSTIQGSRSYDPSKNTWMTPDALAGDVADPASQRTYAYDGNSPYTYADPSGFRARFLNPSQADPSGVSVNEDPPANKPKVIIVFDKSKNKLYIWDQGTYLGDYDASNDTPNTDEDQANIENSWAPAPTGDFNIGPVNPYYATPAMNNTKDRNGVWHTGADGQYGTVGAAPILDIPGEGTNAVGRQLLIHGGRDYLGGWQAETLGCIRTSDSTMALLASILSPDPHMNLLVIEDSHPESPTGHSGS